MKNLSFKEFVDKYGIKNQATSNIKTKEIQDTLSTQSTQSAFGASGVFGILKLNSTGIYKRDDQFTTTSGIVYLHPTKGIHWVIFSNQNYIDLYGCPPPVNIMKQTKNGLYSEYQIQKDDSYCAAYCLYVLYLTQFIGL